MSVRLVDGKWRAYACHKGKRLSQACDSKEHALTVEQQLLAELGRQEVRDHAPREGTMASVMNTCIHLDWAGKSRSMLKNARLVVEYFGPDTLPVDITEQSIDRYLAWMRREGKAGGGCSNATINRHLSTLRIMLKRAVRLRLINQVPLFPEKRLLPEAEPRQLVIRPEWFGALVDEMERRELRESARLSLFLYHIGCRVSEALNLTWDRVNLDHPASLIFTKTKGNKARRLPIPRPVNILLSGLPSRHENREVFHLSYSTYARHYRECTDTVCARLGLSEEVRSQWVIHSLRHTCLTNLASKGWSGAQLRAWSGHQSLSVAERYIHGSAIDLHSLIEQ